jgi:tyrosinase
MLAENLGTSLKRGSTEPDWPPTEVMLNNLININQSINGRHPLWVFWLIVEQGISQLPETHNAGHRFIGGHMGGEFSPNDPIFWLHHANVDRLWATWQQNRIDNGLSTNFLETYPEPNENSPFDGSVAPEGHKVRDVMWPWNANAPGYTSASVSQAIRNRLPVFNEIVTVEDVLDSSSIGVTYQPPS